MTTWASLHMADLMVEFHDGPHATPPPADEGPVYLGIKNITDAGHLDLTSVRHIAESDFGRWTKRVTPEPGDIVFTYEATLHRYALIPDEFRGCLGRRLALIRPNRSVVHPRFLHFAMLGPGWRATVTERIISGSTVDRIPILTFPDFPISLPPLRVQKQVAEILGAIDDLIENNRRRVEVLEEMARAIYREWFVHFRYPGHENATFVDSPLGPIPEDWAVVTLREAGRWLSGGTPRTSVDEYWNGEIPWITSGTLTSVLLDRSDRMVTQLGLENGTRLVPRDALVFVVRGMSLVKEFRVGIADVPVTFGQDCKALLASADFEPLFLALEVISRSEEIQGMHELAGHGTGKLSTDRLQALQLPKPPRTLQKSLVDTIEPIRESMTALRLGSDRLTALRDLLLPKLVTGQVDVSTLDMDVLLEGSVA